MADDISDLEKHALEWFEAVQQHNRFLRGIVSGLGLIVFGLGLYVIGITFLERACH